MLTRNRLGVVRAFGAKVAGTTLGLAFNILLARLLGPSGVGVYYLALAVTGIGATLTRLGLDMAALRFASVAYHRNDMPTLGALYRQCLSLVMVFGTLLTIVTWTISPFLHLGGSDRSDLQSILPIMALSLIPIALLRIQGQFFKSVGEPGLANFVQAGALPASLLVVTAITFLSKEIVLQDIAYIYTTAAFISVIAVMVVFLFRLPGIWSLSGHFDLRLLLRTSLPLLWVASMTMIMGWTDIIVLGIWTESDTVGVYGVATRVTSLMTFILVAVNSVTAPRFAAFHANQNFKSLEKLARKSTAWMALAAIVVALPLLGAPELILAIFGKEFTDGALLLRILVIGQVVNVAAGSVGQLLIMSGNEKVVRNNTLFAITTNLVGNLALVPIIGAAGAALSTALAVIVQNVVLYLKVRKILGIRTLGI